MPTDVPGEGYTAVLYATGLRVEQYRAYCAVPPVTVKAPPQAVLPTVQKEDVRIHYIDHVPPQRGSAPR